MVAKDSRSPLAAPAAAERWTLTKTLKKSPTLRCLDNPMTARSRLRSLSSRDCLEY
jgi:hypothetical protein